MLCIPAQVLQPNEVQNHRERGHRPWSTKFRLTRSLQLALCCPRKIGLTLWFLAIHQGRLLLTGTQTQFTPTQALVGVLELRVCGREKPHSGHALAKTRHGLTRKTSSTSSSTALVLDIPWLCKTVPYPSRPVLRYTAAEVPEQQPRRSKILPTDCHTTLA